MGAVAYTAIITLTPQTAARPKVPTPLPAYLAAQTTPQPPWMISPVPTHSATHFAMSDGWLVVALGVLPCSWEASHSAGGIANPLWSTPAAAPSATAEAPARLQCGVRASKRSRDSMMEPTERALRGGKRRDMLAYALSVSLSPSQELHVARLVLQLPAVPPREHLRPARVAQDPIPVAMVAGVRGLPQRALLPRAPRRAALPRPARLAAAASLVRVRGLGLRV